ncbi:MAG: DNA gyrase subunit A [Cytophagales bacterium]|nr:DNA gyrase subunit A [Cytophagales bacterium]MDW8383420.1 DNA gyrase subunit A [Flammeovirgaceae bacterium]
MDNLESTEISGNAERIIPIFIEDEMKSAYIDYSMSVIVSRALPDVRDGLKPVHRRVLYGMDEGGLRYNRPHKKSARVVGDVLGKYHPHGDSSVYDTIVRMAQPWSLRYPFIDGQGNFGSMDGDAPAAMRYTEVRLTRIAEEMLADIDKNTVDFQPNFDDSTQEPSVLPAKIPNLLLNGSSGIAVGMATNMAPHNIVEVCDGIIAYIRNRNISIAELMQYIKAPDFPTGGIIYGYEGVRKAYETGKGRVVIRAVAHIEKNKSGREQIVVTEVPYLCNPATMIEKTAELVAEKKIEGIAEIRDETDRKGIRIVYELKKDADAQIVLNTLYKMTELQSSFNINNIALVKGRPMLLNLKEIIMYYVEHRHEVVVRRTQFELEKALKRSHILEGFLKALDVLDEIIALIRASANKEEAKAELITQFSFTDVQADAILEMRLQQLTGLEREKIRQEYDELTQKIERLKAILSSEDLRYQIIIDELNEIKEKFGDKRLSKIEINAEDLDIEDMIPNDEMVITITHEGYIKRTALSEYRTQSRGGVGAKGAGAKEDDYPTHLFVAKNHNYLLIFTAKGKLYWLKAYKVPEGNKTSKGRPIQNLIAIEPDDAVRAVVNVPTLEDKKYITSHYVMMCTKKGIVKKTELSEYANIRQSGIIAIHIAENDELYDAQLTDGKCNVIIGISNGMAIRFDEEKVRPMGRNATGVIGVDFDVEKDRIIGMVTTSNPHATILVVSQKGYGKRTELEDYRLTNRGGKGVTTLKVTEKTGELAGILVADDSSDLMIITKNGIAIRMPMASISVIGRATQGVRLIRLNEGDEIASVTRIEAVEQETETVSPTLFDEFDSDEA